LESLAFKALDSKEPQIQKVSIDLYYQKEFGIPEDELATFGLVNLVLESGGSFLFFTHQSFQEYLAAKYASKDDKLMQKVIDEMWDPKWHEVIKFLAGFRGEGIVLKVYQRDNVIHAGLFLATECAGEVRSVDKALTKILQEKIKPLLFEIAYGYDARFALKNLGDKVDAEMVRQLAGMLRDENPDVRRTATDTLKEFADRVDAGMVLQIADLLRDEVSRVRESAARTLGKLVDKVDARTVRQLADLLRDDDAGVRANVYRTLQKLYAQGTPLKRTKESLFTRFIRLFVKYTHVMPYIGLSVYQ
jgi:predicted NACHT family NTPase